MRTMLASAMVALGLVGTAGAVPRQSIVTIFDGVQFVDSATPQSVQVAIPTGKFGGVTLVSQLTDVTNPALSGLPITCIFTMTETTDPATTLSVAGFSGTIGRDGYSGGSAAVLAPFLLCRISVAGNVASRVTVKALFTK